MSKFFNVNEAAKLLGLSPMTVRRRIMDNEIHAEMISKRLGYKISEEELVAFAKKMNHKIGFLWSKDVDVDFSHSKAIAAITPSAFNINTPELIQRLKKRHLYTPAPSELDDLNVLDKIINLLQEKLNFVNSKISRLSKETDRSLDDLLDDQMALKEDIGNFEIHRSVCELRQNKNLGQVGKQFES